MRRELSPGWRSGRSSATIGFIRIVLWQRVFHAYGEHYLLVALTVAA